LPRPRPRWGRAASTTAGRPDRRGRATAHLDRPTAGALIADLRAALAGRLVVCVTHDDLEQPGDTVVRLDREVA